MFNYQSRSMRQSIKLYEHESEDFEMENSGIPDDFYQYLLDLDKATEIEWFDLDLEQLEFDDLFQDD